MDNFSIYYAGMLVLKETFILNRLNYSFNSVISHVFPSKSPFITGKVWSLRTRAQT